MKLSLMCLQTVKQLITESARRKGEVWFDNLKLEVVDKNVPVTSPAKEMNLSKEPVNLDFEE